MLDSPPNFRKACADFFQKSVPLDDSVCFYRSGDLSQISSDCAKQLVNELGLQCHIDLRSEDEIAKRGYSVHLEKMGILRVSFPLKDPSQKLSAMQYPEDLDYFEHYRILLETNHNSLCEMIRFINDSRLKRFVMSCYAGKDRTGLCVMLIMGLVGVSRKQIVADYALTGEYLEREINFFKENWEKRGLTQAEYSLRIRPRTVAFEMILDYLDQKYGGVSGFFMKQGLNKEDISALKKNLEN